MLAQGGLDHRKSIATQQIACQKKNNTASVSLHQEQDGLQRRTDFIFHFFILATFDETKMCSTECKHTHTKEKRERTAVLAGQSNTAIPL